ncbi:hypothetical protein PCANC_16881, partial [Puccinia coronata f. sp. avenae]
MTFKARSILLLVAIGSFQASLALPAGEVPVASAPGGISLADNTTSPAGGKTAGTAVTLGDNTGVTPAKAAGGFGGGGATTTSLATPGGAGAGGGAAGGGGAAAAKVKTAGLTQAELVEACAPLLNAPKLSQAPATPPKNATSAATPPKSSASQTQSQGQAPKPAPGKDRS